MPSLSPGSVGRDSRRPIAALVALLLSSCTGGGAGATISTTAPAPPPAATVVTPTSSGQAPTLPGETAEALVARVLIDRERLIEVTVSANGDWRVDDDTERTSLAFDAVARTLHTEVAGERHAHVGLAPSGPDSPLALLDAYLPVVAVSGGLGKRAAGTTREGWWEGGPTLDFADHFRRPTLSPGSYGDEVTDHVWVSLDAATLLPVSVTHASDQRPVEVTVRRWEVVELTVTTVDRSRFRLWEESAVDPVDHGFSAVGPSGTHPRPSWLPDGYALASVDAADDPLQWWSYPSLPPSQRVTVITYRRGAIETLTITVRDAATGNWQDPYHRGDMDLTGTAHTTPEGRSFSVVTGPWPFWPVTHAWGITDGLVVTVGGDVTADELRRILDGLIVDDG